MFATIEFNNDMFNSINNTILLNNRILDNKVFFNYINKDYISISGSSILQILSNEYYDKSDLDIYIELNKLNMHDYYHIKNFIKYLYIHFLQNAKCDYNYYEIINKFSYVYYKNVSNNNIHNDVDSNSKYLSLGKYLKLYIPFEIKNKKIELIFISSDIENVLLNTFDYDIVKNYWKRCNIYAYNNFAIMNRIGTMSITHFTDRVLNNQKEFKNFISRFNKYTKRGYKLFIHKTLLTQKICTYILNIFNSRIIPFHHLINSNVHFKLHLNSRAYIALYSKFYFLNKYEEYFMIYEIKNHIVKYLTIAAVINNYTTRKKLTNYSNSLLHFYLNPNSQFIKYKANRWHLSNVINYNKSLCYINSNNELKIFTIITN